MDEIKADGVPTAMLRRLQIVVGVLVLGVIGFAVATVFIRLQGPPVNVPPVPIISCVAVGFALVMLANRFALVPLIAKSGRKKLLALPEITTRQLMEQFASRTVVGAALLEGSAFFLLTTYIIEGQPWTLAGGLVMAGLLAVLQFPTRPRVEAAIESDRQAIENDRAAF